MLHDAAVDLGAEKLRGVGFKAEHHDARLLGIEGQQIAWPDYAVLLPCLNRMASKSVNKNKATQRDRDRLSKLHFV